MLATLTEIKGSRYTVNTSHKARKFLLDIQSTRVIDGTDLMRNIPGRVFSGMCRRGTLVHLGNGTWRCR